jgi:uncharacterized membrane protein YciS (DUF1049 family)
LTKYHEITFIKHQFINAIIQNFYWMKAEVENFLGSAHFFRVGRVRPLLCFSLFYVRVRVGFEPRKLQNKQRNISIKKKPSMEFSFNHIVIAKFL